MQLIFYATSFLEVTQKIFSPFIPDRLLTGSHGISMDEAIIAFLRSSLSFYCIPLAQNSRLCRYCRKNNYQETPCVAVYRKCGSMHHLLVWDSSAVFPLRMRRDRKGHMLLLYVAET